MKNKNISVIFSFGILLILLLFLVLVLNIEVERKLNWDVMFTYIIIGISCIAGIIADKYKFSINKTFWYFSFFFFCIAPIIQYVTNYYPWKYYIEDEIFLKTNILIIISFIVYEIVRIIAKNIKKCKIKRKIILFKEENASLFFIFSIISTVIFIGIVGFNGIIGRKTNSIELENDNIKNIVNLIFRTVPVFALVIYYTLCKNKGIKINKIKVIIMLICILISAFPTSMTRFLMGTIYIGILVVLTKNKLGKRTYDMLIIITFLVLFPLLYSFKYITIKDAINNGIELNGMKETYDSVDFDAYSMFSRTILYTENNGYTYGNQLLSSIFFFIPRSIWQTKPRVTSGLVASSQNAKYTNLSCPFLAEGYIELGLFSMIIYIGIFSYVVKKLDDKYWTTLETKNKFGIRYIEIIYPFLLGLSLFLLRGSLQPVIVYSFGFFLIAIIIYIYKLIRKQYIKEEKEDE